MVGTLRLCFTNTLHESKLTSIFVQETQGYYLLENLMALARDYVYQIVQNPREPHLFLSASAFRTKDKTALASDEDNKDKWVIDFNGSLSKQQIVPNDFSLQIADDGWDIKGGPIFWQDNKKNENDERYLAEVFMIGSLNLVSNFIPDWTVRTVQMMEIERNPLCDFQLYSEGDTTMTTNARGGWPTTIDGPVQVNGNIRFMKGNGVVANSLYFNNKVNSAGYVFHIRGDAIDSSFNLPQKYHMWNLNDIYIAPTQGYWDDFYINSYAINYNSPSNTKLLSCQTNPSDDAANRGNYDSYERYVFSIFKGNFTPLSRVYRPIGFDPGNYWGFWETGMTQPAVTSDVVPNEQVLNFCFGFHNLAQNSSNSTHGLYALGNEDPYSPATAMSDLRGLTNYQMTEKARLIDMQKPVNFPAFIISLPTKTNTSSSLYVPNNFVYSTYIYDAFPAKKDNVYFWRYLNLVFQNESVINESYLYTHFNVVNTTNYYYANSQSPTLCISKNNMTMFITNNKLAHRTLTCNTHKNEIPYSNFLKLKSTFSPSGYSDDSCPPDKLVDNGTHWTVDNYITRITSGEHYNFMYDRNRSKWIQMVDIDVGALKTALEANDTWQGSTVEPVVVIDGHWQGKCAQENGRNYLRDGIDIRHFYREKRKIFFTFYAEKDAAGAEVPPYENDASHPPVIDIGVRLSNATTLPDKGLTLYCPYPLYIKGNFNTNNPKPALIVTDSLTLLPNMWQDWRSQMDPQLTYLNYHTTNKVYMNCPNNIYGPTIYADIITGRTHPHFWIMDADTKSKQDQSKDPVPDMGFYDGLRWLCGMYQPAHLYGSLMLPYFCQEQWEPPINFARFGGSDPGIYSHIYLTMHPRENVGIPAGMPFYYRINRGRKTHCLGDTAYNTLIGNTLYNKDWHDTNNTFANYQTALPNYLK